MKNNSYLRFTRQDIKGILSLLILILILMAGPVLLRFLLSGGPVSLDYKEIRQAGISASSDSSASLSGRRGSGLKYTPFNPNQASAEVWMQTGLAPYKVKMILNYVRKGGHFYRAADIHRIYSLDSADCRILLPLLKIPEERKGYPFTLRNRRPYVRYASEWVREPFPAFKGKISLNLATYEEFRSLGILSPQNIRMLIRYRERNGNFADIRELKNTQLLDLPTYTRLRPFLRL